MMSAMKVAFRFRGSMLLTFNNTFKSAYRKYGTNIGNSLITSVNESAGAPEKWMKFWFLNMKRKAELEGPDTPMPRANQQNWNYKAELVAFQTRLGLNCKDDLLQAAFREPVSSDACENYSTDNSQLSVAGKHFIESFVSHYVDIALPHLPEEGKHSVEMYLTNHCNLAFLARNLGYQDLLQTMTFPPHDETLSNCFLAVLQVINISEGPVAAGRFLLDFVVPCLNGKDILDDIWKPLDPMSLLTEELRIANKTLPEARLTKQSGINTVLPVFYVALFSGSELLSESGGESISLAETDAANQALKKLFKVHPNSASLPMGMSVDNEFLKKLFEPLLASQQNGFERDVEKFTATQVSS